MKIKDKVLIVEDEQSISNFISMILTANGFDTIVVRSGEEALTMIASHCPDLIVLDLGLPDMDGLDILRQLRSWSTLPVVVVSARSHEQDKVSALDLGADDYLTKPFGILELKARVQALLRRTARNRRTSVLTGQDITLNCDTRDVTKGDAPLELTFKEFELLKLLMENSDRVMTRSELLNLVWGIDFEGETRTLDMHIRTLRQKLGDDAETPRYIRTVRGVGYRFNCG